MLKKTMLSLNNRSTLSYIESLLKLDDTAKQSIVSEKLLIPLYLRVERKGDEFFIFKNKSVLFQPFSYL